MKRISGWFRKKPKVINQTMTSWDGYKWLQFYPTSSNSSAVSLTFYLTDFNKIPTKGTK